jgi:hypothetical protein
MLGAEIEHLLRLGYAADRDGRSAIFPARMTSSSVSRGSITSCRNMTLLQCCTYDLTQFGASVVMDILRTHPQVIVGNVLRENPFYVPPDEFLAELRGGSATVPDVE